MIGAVRKLIYKILGLNILQHNIQAEFDALHRELKVIRTLQQDNTSPFLRDVEELDQRKLDERLDYYFKWKLPIQLSPNSTVLFTQMMGIAYILICVNHLWLSIF